MEAGSWADWISAISTFGALLAAGFAVAQAVRANRHQQTQVEHLQRADERRQQDERAADARRVAFWPGVRPDRPDSPFIYYANTSGLPIYDLTLTITLPDGAVTISYHSLAPEPAHRSMERTRRGLREYVQEHGPQDWPLLMAENRFQCAATFRDTSGTRWTRSDDGRLTELQNVGTQVDPPPDTQ